MGLVSFISSAARRVTGRPTRQYVEDTHLSRRNYGYRSSSSLSEPEFGTVYTRGAGAHANVIKSSGTAIASVNSPSGASAYASTDGLNKRVNVRNGGSAGVNGGTAWAKTRHGNAVAHSSKAKRRAKRRSTMPVNTLRSYSPPILESNAGRDRGSWRNHVPPPRSIARKRAPSPEWELYGRGGGMAAIDESSAAYIERGEYVLTNGKEAMFFEHTKAGYMDRTSAGYMETSGAGYLSSSRGVYIESGEYDYDSD